MRQVAEQEKETVDEKVGVSELQVQVFLEEMSLWC